VIRYLNKGAKLTPLLDDILQPFEQALMKTDHLDQQKSKWRFISAVPLLNIGAGE
jgi:hypothetical protein